MSIDITLEEHREFRHKLLGVQLYFTALWAKAHPEESISSIIEDRTQIYKFTDENPQSLSLTEVFYSRPGWQRLMTAAQTAWNECGGCPKSFENKLKDIFGESVDRRIQRDYQEVMMPPRGFQCGCLRHDDAPWRGTGWLCFHIGNPLKPHSIFENKDYLKHCLLVLADHAEQMFGVKYVSTNTWLNSNPKWLKYFPPEWLENMRPANESVQGHLGYWGQFVNARGLFNDRADARFRETGKLPFAARESFCAAESLRKHLASL